MRSEVLVAAGSARKLDDQAFAHEVGAICTSKEHNRKANAGGMDVRKAIRAVSDYSQVSVAVMAYQARRHARP